MTTTSNLRVTPQYSPHGKLEAYKVERHMPLPPSADYPAGQADRWISIRVCLTREQAEQVVSGYSKE